jgi:hypothetical protein
MNRKTARKIIFELSIRGVAHTKAKQYISLVEQFEKDSDNKGELHHILPKNAGWWRKYSTEKWNLVLVSWHYHVALHAYLAYLFPENRSMKRALRATTLLKRLTSKKVLQNKERIIRWYKSGKSLEWIAKQIGYKSACGLSKHLWSWGVQLRSGTAPTSPKKEKYKSWIIKQYLRGWTVRRVGSAIGISGTTICIWLRSWGVEIRKPKDRKLWSKKLCFKSRMMSWYESGKSAKWISKRVRVDVSTVFQWLKDWGVKLNQGKGKMK